MKPELHKANLNTLTYDNTTREGYLTDCISCIVTEERNGIFELEAVFPVGGCLTDHITVGSVIRSKTGEEMTLANTWINPIKSFDVYDIKKTIKGRITVRAAHISYRLLHIPVIYTPGFSHSDKIVSHVLDSILLSAEEPTAYKLGYLGDFSEIATDFATGIKVPRSLKECLAGKEGSVVDRFGGEWLWQDKKATLCKERGTTHGISGAIRYGHNMQDLTYRVNGENIVTGVLPYWADSDGNNAITGDIQYSEDAGNYTTPRTAVHNFSEDFQDQPTKDQLNAAAAAYVRAKLQTKPAETLQTRFVPLWQALDISTADLPAEQINLCDTLPVIHEGYGISTTAKVVRVEYDALRERYTSIEIGTVQKRLEKMLAQTANAAGVSLYV